MVFGAPDPKTGAAGSVLNLFGEPRLNHQTELRGGVLAEPCGQLLRDFFAERRARQRAERSAANRASALIAVEAHDEPIPTGEAIELTTALQPAAGP